MLVLAEITDSFEFISVDAHWLSQLIGKNLTVKKPSIPPQLWAFVQKVAFDIDWEKFVAKVRSSYPDIVKVARLKNRNLKDLTLVKVEIKSLKVRNKIIERTFISIADT